MFRQSMPQSTFFYFLKLLDCSKACLVPQNGTLLSKNCQQKRVSLNGPDKQTRMLPNQPTWFLLSWSQLALFYLRNIVWNKCPEKLLNWIFYGSLFPILGSFFFFWEINVLFSESNGSISFIKVTVDVTITCENIRKNQNLRLVPRNAALVDE